MRPFELHRDIDETGVSGTGVIAEGIEFADGSVALRWLSDWPTSVVFHDRGIRSVEAVHGHGGKTRIVFWVTPEDTPTQCDRCFGAQMVGSVQHADPLCLRCHGTGWVTPEDTQHAK